eukprot:TRINITY_DN4831_c0_g1_i2.p1 TRINITY_DN4831_c0_g1~~TRINITY_DN4831_c0_g1_i2.p1  ORF type:complete len:233 (+),score=72.07 TRINITY_DN4831_c0_g1_i2:265-963(+)
MKINQTMKRKNGVKVKWITLVGMMMAFGLSYLFVLYYFSISIRSEEDKSIGRSTISMDSRIVSEDDNDSPSSSSIDFNEFKISINCQHSKEGKGKIVVDSNGFICNRSQLIPSSNCCPSSYLPSQSSNKNDEHNDIQWRKKNRFECKSCDWETNCCSIYEYCISCCLNPSKRQIVKEMNSTIGPKSSLLISSKFELCQFVCRTSSKCLLHENTYRGSFKYCFGTSFPPLEPS